MSLDLVKNLLQGAINNNAQVTLITLSVLVLVYTIMVSGFKQEWARYVFLILIGCGIYAASLFMTDTINRDFFSSLSTELFGAAITLTILGKWMMPSLWWLVILVPMVILSELFIYRIPNPEIRSYYLGISSNIWGAFLVAILIDELVHERNTKKGPLAALTNHREKLREKYETLELQTAEFEKHQLEAMLKEKEKHKERLQIVHESTHPKSWDIEIKIYGRNPADMQHKITRIKKITHVVHVSEIYKHTSKEHCHCYIKAKFPPYTNGTGGWAVLSASAITEDAQVSE